MASGREARMQQRMRGAQRHQVQDAEFDLFFDLPTGLDAIPAPLEPVEPAPPALPTAPPPQSPPQPVPDQTTPSRSAKRRRLNSGGSASATSQAARTLGSRPSQEEIGESPLNAPGSGRRRSVIATAAAAGHTTALHQAVSGHGGIASPSSGKGKSNNKTTKPVQRDTHTRTASANTNSPDDAPRRNDEPSPELSTMIQVPSSTAGLSIANNATTNDNAADELSSPAFGIALDAVDDITMSGMVPSSSPLARKSTAGGRAVSKRNSGGPAATATTASTTTRLVISETPLADRTQTLDEPDELSPDQPAPSIQQQRAGRPSQTRQASEVPSSSPVTHVAKRMPSQKNKRIRSKQSTIPTVEEAPELEPEPEPEHEQEQAPQEDDENEEAEEIDAAEAARTIGKKRPRRSTVHEPSPELGSQSIEAESVASPETRPNKKKRQRDQDQSQSKPPKNSSSKASKSKRVSSATAPAAKKQRRQKRKRRDDGDSGDDDDDELEGGGGGRVERGSRSRGAPVPITVQRFTKMRMSAVRRSHSNGDGSDDDDELAAAGDMPFASRSGVNAVDVLAQICEDIVEQKLQQLQEKHEQMRRQAAEEGDDGGGGGSGSAATIAAARKDIQAARRALESFQQELRTRLLEQAVAVDTLYAMRKRVRAVHKEKLALREEILRIRAERDQVGLRMDALRSQHQQRVGQAMKATQMSTTMFDIDLAVEQGRAAPELTPAQQKTAELANLELVVRRIASQVAGGRKANSGSGGGTLHQIKEFNAFLERTAAVLEGRRLPAKAVV